MNRNGSRAASRSRKPKILVRPPLASRAISLFSLFPSTGLAPPRAMCGLLGIVCCPAGFAATCAADPADIAEQLLEEAAITAERGRLVAVRRKRNDFAHP